MKTSVLARKSDRKFIQQAFDLDAFAQEVIKTWAKVGRKASEVDGPYDTVYRVAKKLGLTATICGMSEEYWTTYKESMWDEGKPKDPPGVLKVVLSNGQKIKFDWDSPGEIWELEVKR